MTQSLVYIQAHWQGITAALVSALKVAQLITGSIIANGSKSPTVATINGVLVDVLPQLSLPSVRNPAPVVGAPLKMLMVCLALGSLSACAGLTGATIESDLISCGAPVSIPVGAGVLSALTGPSNQVETSLEGLGLTYGVQTVSCVVKDMVDQEEAKLAVAQGVTPAAYSPNSLPNLTLIVRGEQYLHGWRLTGGKLLHHRVQ